MELATGPLLSALLLAVLLSSLGAWWVAGRYRRRMIALMRGGPPPDATRPSALAEPTLVGQREPVVPQAAPYHRAARRQGLALLGLCLIIGLTQSWLALLFVYDDRGVTLNRLVVLGIVYAWPLVLAWGLGRRWAWTRVLVGVAVYMIAMLGVVLLASTGAQTLSGVANWLGTVVALPILVTLALTASGRIRAVAPYLLPPLLVLCMASMLVLQTLAAHVDDPPAWVIRLVGYLGATATLTLLALGPWLLLAWPVRALAYRLSIAYRRKRFSDQTYLFAAYWFVVLAASTLVAVEGAGALGLTQMLPWLWIPLAATALTGWLVPTASPSTLLVLRVFQRDAAVELLFDRVVERWRLTGNTLLIAGTDLISRTLDPDDLFAFLNGRLASRFIAREEEIPRRMAELDLAPDPDGRYRVNELYCFDTTWQAALRTLVAHSDVVLMDLRGFRAENRGCRFELSELAQAPHLGRVVLLYDAGTDRHAATFDLAGGPADRFIWIPADHLDEAKAGEIIAALLEPTGGASGAAGLDAPLPASP